MTSAHSALTLSPCSKHFLFCAEQDNEPWNVLRLADKILPPYLKGQPRSQGLYPGPRPQAREKALGARLLKGVAKRACHTRKTIALTCPGIMSPQHAPYYLPALNVVCCLLMSSSRVKADRVKRLLSRTYHRVLTHSWYSPLLVVFVQTPHLLRQRQQT